MKKYRVVIATMLATFIGIAPIVANADYRTALISGNLATFVTPYRIPNDLKEIKALLSTEKTNRLFILPTLESGREIIQDGTKYSFLDKYLIYYLNEPTFYYGVGANTDNKVISYLVYRAIAYDETWWEDILANNLGITAILVPQHIKPREKGTTYLPGIEGKVETSLARSSKYQKTYEGNDYDLYTLKKIPSNQMFLVDMQWQNTLEYLNTKNLTDSKLLFPLQLRTFLASSSEKKIMTTSLERTYYNLYAYSHPAQTFTPRPVSLPFNPEYVASSNFTNNALSLSSLYNKKDQYNYLHEKVPSLMNLQRPSFVGLTKGNARLDIKLDAPSDDKYRLLLHVGSKNDVIRVNVAGKDIFFKKIQADQHKNVDYVDMSYFYADVVLKKGQVTIGIQNKNQASILVDSATLLPVRDIPATFDAITLPGLTIKATDQPLIYEVEKK